MDTLMSQINSIVHPGLTILIVTLYGFGIMLKGLEKVKDCFIPFILLPIGIILSMLIVGFNATAFMEGVICVMVACYSNQLIKQGKEIALLVKSNKEDIDY